MPHPSPIRLKRDREHGLLDDDDLYGDDVDGAAPRGPPFCSKRDPPDTSASLAIVPADPRQLANLTNCLNQWGKIHAQWSDARAKLRKVGGGREAARVAAWRSRRATSASARRNVAHGRGRGRCRVVCRSLLGASARRTASSLQEASPAPAFERRRFAPGTTVSA